MANNAGWIVSNSPTPPNANGGWTISDSPTKAPSLTANPNGEGLYRMGSYDFNQGNVSKPEIQVPFSRVPEAQKAGYQLHPDEAPRYQKDFTHQGQGPTLLDRLNSTFARMTEPMPDQPLEFNSNPSVGSAFRSAPAALANVGRMPFNLVNRTVRGLASVPGGIVQTGKSIYAGEPEGLESVNPVAMGEGEWKNLQADTGNLGPAAAWSNAGGDAVTAYLAGKGTAGIVNRGANIVRNVPGLVKRPITGNLDAPIPGTEVTPRQRYNAMVATGVQPDAAQATNSPLLSAAKHVNQNSLTSSGIYEARRAQNIQALDNYTKNALNEMSPLPSEEGGAAVQQGLLDNQQALKTQAEQGFKTLDAQRGNTPIAGSAALQKQAQGILDQNADYYKQHPELEPRQAMAITRNIANGGPSPRPAPKVVPGFGAAFRPPIPGAQPRIPGFMELHRLRSDLLDFNNTNPDLVKNQANGWISQLAGGADQAITSGEGGLTPSQTNLFRESNAAWKDMKNTYDNPQSPLYHAVRTDQPSRLVNGISQTPEMAQNLRIRLGDQGIGPIQRGVAEKTLGTTKEGNYNFRNFQGMFNKLPQSYRESLYSPPQLQAMDNIGQTGTVLNAEANPSGSARLGQKIAEGSAIAGSVFHPVALGLQGLYHGAQYTLGRTMNSPGVVRWLMTPPNRAPVNPLMPPVIIPPNRQR